MRDLNEPASVADLALAAGVVFVVVGMTFLFADLGSLYLRTAGFLMGVVGAGLVLVGTLTKARRRR